jgi:hypothetical protein
LAKRRNLPSELGLPAFFDILAEAVFVVADAGEFLNVFPPVAKPALQEGVYYFFCKLLHNLTTQTKMPESCPDLSER